MKRNDRKEETMSMYTKSEYEEVARGRKFGFDVVMFEKQT